MQGIPSSDLFEADLCGANLHNADLDNAGLYAACLRGADFHMASLRGANLRHADIIKTDLRGAEERARRAEREERRERLMAESDAKPDSVLRSVDITGTDAYFLGRERKEFYHELAGELHVLNTLTFRTRVKGMLDGLEEV